MCTGELTNIHLRKLLNPKEDQGCERDDVPRNASQVPGNGNCLIPKKTRGVNGTAFPGTRLRFLGMETV